MSKPEKKENRKKRIAPPKISPNLGHRYILRVSPRPFVKTGGSITVALRELAPHSRHRKIITGTQPSPDPPYIDPVPEFN